MKKVNSSIFALFILCLHFSPFGEIKAQESFHEFYEKSDHFATKPLDEKILREMEEFFYPFGDLESQESFYSFQIANEDFFSYFFNDMFYDEAEKEDEYLRAAGGSGGIDVGSGGSDDGNNKRNDAPLGDGILILSLFASLYILRHKKSIVNINQSQSK